MNKKNRLAQKYVDHPILSISYPYLVLLVGLMLLHLFCITKVELAQLVSLLETFVVVFFILRKKLPQAVLLFGVFILTSYDNDFFFAEPVGVDRLYNVSFLPIVSSYFYLFLSFLLFALSLHKIIKYKMKFDNILIRFAIFSIATQIIMAFPTIFVDGFSLFSITRDIKLNIVPCLWAIIFFFLCSNEKFVSKYEKLIIHILFAYIIAGIITVSFNFYLVRGPRATLLYLPLASFFSTSIILFLYKFKRKLDKIFIEIMFGFSVVFQLLLDNCLGGKSWFVFVSVIIVGLYLYFRKIAHGVAVKIISIVVVLSASIVLSPKIVSYVNNSENGKLFEFISLFEGAQSGDLDDVDASAQFRFLEFITISDYYRSHPQFLLLGKGLGGGVPNSGFFVYSETAFSDDQYSRNNFSVMHESINVIYLKTGLVGLVFLVIVLFSGFKRIKYEPLFYIGCVWMFFYWAYSLNLLFIGLPAFVIAYKKWTISTNSIYT